jgi:parallel beta-helix repeat protein
VRGVLTKLSATVVLAFTMLALTVTPAIASHVQCGDVITQDTTLDSDLIDCRSDGIVIGADNIMLDLNGHTVDGYAPDGGRAYQGIHSEGHDGVVIENGTVTQFVTGVASESGGRDVVVRRMTLADSAAGAFVFGGSGVVIKDNVMFLNVDGGIWVDRSAGVDIRRNTILDEPGGNGITVDGSADANIEHNVIKRQQIGMLVSTSARPTVSKNSVDDNHDGIIVGASRDGGRIEANSASRNVSFGISVVEATGFVVTKNSAHDNEGDGIQVESGNTVAKNTANQNGDYGIEASPGVIDGGGNKASGNGNPSQCLNVFCK